MRRRAIDPSTPGTANPAGEAPGRRRRPRGRCAGTPRAHTATSGRAARPLRDARGRHGARGLAAHAGVPAGVAAPVDVRAPTAPRGSESAQTDPLSPIPNRGPVQATPSARCARRRRGQPHPDRAPYVPSRRASATLGARSRTPTESGSLSIPRRALEVRGLDRYRCKYRPSLGKPSLDCEKRPIGNHSVSVDPRCAPPPRSGPAAGWRAMAADRSRTG